MKVSTIYPFFFTPIEIGIAVLFLMWFMYPLLIDRLAADRIREWKDKSATAVQKSEEWKSKHDAVVQESKEWKDESDAAIVVVADIKAELEKTQNELTETKNKLESVTKDVSKLEQRVWDWRDYGIKASAFQDFLEKKPEAKNCNRPNFPESWF